MRSDIARLRGFFDPPGRGGRQDSGGGTEKGGSGPAGSRKTSRPAQCILGCPIRAVVLALLWTAAPVHAQQPYKPVYKLSIAVGPAYAWGRGADIWAGLIRERTAGRINIRLFPGASATAGDAAREFAALREGAIDLAVGSALNWAESVKPLHLFALPFLFASPRALDVVVHGEIGAEMMKAVADAGVVPLAWGDNGFREVSTADRALRKPDDLAGLRIRASGGTLVEETLNALGATPVKLKPLEAQRAFLDGSLHGQEAGLTVYSATKAHTLGQKQVTLLSFAADPLIFAVSRQAWEGWSEADRMIVRQAAAEAARREIDLARNADAAALASLTELRGAGVVVTRLKPDERYQFVLKTKAVLEKWSATIGSGLVQRAQDAIAASTAR